MQVGAVRSYTEAFFSFKGNKILIKLTCPVFQVIMREKSLTITSKKVEFRFNQDLTSLEAFVMGRKIDFNEFRKDYEDLQSNFWISTTVDSSDLSAKLDGMAKACDGTVIFLDNFPNLSASLNEILKFANKQVLENKNIIRKFCERNIELLNNQIRLLNQDKLMYQELEKTI